MAIPFLIIDGYNLMHAAGIAKATYAQGDMERCRHQLQLRISEALDTRALGRTTLVYDAFASISDDRRIFRKHGMKIRFAPMGHDADSEIEKLLSKHSAPRQVIVVSSDHRLHKAARRRKARCVDSEIFLQQIELETPPTSRRRKPQPDSNPPLPSDANGKTADSPFDNDYLSQLQDDIENGEL